jgi:murein L,D-transpeptidase YafK
MGMGRRRRARGVLVAMLALASLGAARAGEPARSPLAQADRVVIEKGARTLTLFSGWRRLASFEVALGREPRGAKRCQGDNRTPEGLYRVSGRKENSDFHRALRISYPSDDDVARARAAGCDPGGDIMIHGLKPDWASLGKQHRRDDWTRGCIAVTNEEIERIWALVPDGAEVEILP